MENKKVLKLTDFQKNEENPFMKQAIEGIENHVVKKYKSSTGSDKKAVVAVADTDTGEVFKTSFIRQIEVDEEQFAKLYLANFAAFFNLSQSAIRVFGYILTCMKPKNDMIIFDRRKCLEYTQYKSDKAIYKGLAELVQSEIIARGPNEYNWFINPLIVFNGDRVSFTKTYVRKKTLHRSITYLRYDSWVRQVLQYVVQVLSGEKSSGLILQKVFVWHVIQIFKA